MFGDALAPTTQDRRSFVHLWWLNPIWPLALMLLGTGYAAYIIPGGDYITNWKTPKFFDGQSMRFIIESVAGFVASGMIVTVLFRLRRPTFSEVIEKDTRLPWPTLWFIFRVGFALTVLAYVVWVVLSAASGLSIDDVKAALHNDPTAAYAIREKTDTLPGVTTFTQLAMAVVLLGTMLGFKFGWRQNLFKIVLPLAVVIGLAVLRSRFRAERVAIIELAVPMAILSIALLHTERWRALWRWVIALLPLAGPVVLYVFFSAAEYSRSWINFYKYQSDTTFFAFTFQRLVGYYVTALNNGACFVQTIGKFQVPYHTFEFFWKFPLTKLFFPYPLPEDQEPQDGYQHLLKERANVELNNPSGVFVIQLDWGHLGGIAVWCIIGAIAMLLYRLFREGSPAGLLIYPLFYIGLLESPRILYWTATRSFPSWIMLLGIVVLIGLARTGDFRKRRGLAPAQPSGPNPVISRRRTRRGL